MQHKRGSWGHFAAVAETSAGMISAPSGPPSSLHDMKLTL